jgi:hypothetical protein
MSKITERNTNLKLAIEATNYDSRIAYCAIAQVYETGRLVDETAKVANETARLADATEFGAMIEYVRVLKDLNNVGMVSDQRVLEVSEALTKRFERIMG